VSLHVLTDQKIVFWRVLNIKLRASCVSDNHVFWVVVTSLALAAEYAGSSE